MSSEIKDWQELMAQADDLGRVQDALVRERVIRDVMTQTGEGRDIVADLFNAVRSMDGEAVLDLVEGEPTTLAAALDRYVDGLEALPDGYDLTVAEAIGNLRTLLEYAWPGSSPDDWVATGAGNMALTEEVHAAYVRLAPERGFEMITWDRLSTEQRDLALAVMADVVRRGVIVVPGS